MTIQPFSKKIRVKITNISLICNSLGRKCGSALTEKKHENCASIFFYLYIYMSAQFEKGTHFFAEHIILLNLFKSDYVLDSRNINLEGRVKNYEMYIGSQNFGNFVELGLSELLQKGHFVKIRFVLLNFAKIIEEITTNLLFHQVPVARIFFKT